MHYKYFYLFLATYSTSISADVSILFDVGGIAGAIIAGSISDHSGMSALTCAVMFGFAIPVVCTTLCCDSNGNTILCTKYWKYYK